MKTVLNRLGSIKLTLAVLLIIACTAAFGTFLPQGGDLETWQSMVGRTGTRVAVLLGFTDFYHSLWFTALLAILVVNLIVCTVNRIPGMLHARSGKAALGREAAVDIPDSDISWEKTAAVLRNRGFRSKGKGGNQVFTRGSSGFLYTLLTHGSILIIMASSIFGSAAGFIATKRLYVDDSISTAFNWKAGGERPLPFELRVEDFTLLPNPVGVRLGVLEMETSQHGKMITTHEGSTFKVPGIEGRIKLENFDIERKEFLASWTAADGSRIEFGSDQEIGDSGISLVLLAFATWPERQAIASVSLMYPDGEDRSGEISVNHPMVSGGIRIYLTDYGQDKFGFPYVGFQFVRDPGQIGVWVGCILFLACLPGTVFMRHSCVVLLRENGRLRMHISSKENREDVVARLMEDLASTGLRTNGGSGEA